jgi:hypothetical protein
MPREFSRTDFEAAVADYKENWQLTDEVLLRLCRDHPNHDTQASVNAKVIIVGRSYATGIERKVTSTGGPGGGIAQTADFLCTHGGTVDHLIQQLRELEDEPLTFSKLSTIFEVHGSFVNLLADLAADRQSLRSFASKYLYFHVPIIPIYDEVAAVRILPGLSPLNRVVQKFKQPPDTDYDYHRHVLRFFDLYSRIDNLGLRVNIKYLDAYLLWLAGQPQPL